MTMIASAQASGLETLWFLLISILWLGYFVLEGFDFGVGMLIKFMGKTTEEKRAIIHTIGPVWDANEVWVLTAGGATFAAFPELYATLFSGAYIALFLILFALIARGVAFEFWGKRDTPGWRSLWEWAMVVGSALPALLWGVAWANLVKGLPVQALLTNNTLTEFQGVQVPKIEFAGTLFSLLGPYALLGGVVTLLLFLLHGAVFLLLRLKQGEVKERVRAFAKKLAPATAIVTLLFVIWSVIIQAGRPDGATAEAAAQAGASPDLIKALAPFLVVQTGIEIISVIFLALAVLAAVYAVMEIKKSETGRHAGRAFASTTASIVTLFIGLFAWQYPNAAVGTLKTNDVVPDGLDGTAVSLPLHMAASTPLTLKVMTVVAVIFVPIVLAYTAWTYWVFRARLGAEDFGDVRNPGDLYDRHRARKNGGDGHGEGLPETS